MNIKTMMNRKLKKILADKAIQKLNSIEEKEAPEGYINLFNTGLRLELRTLRAKGCKLARTLIENYRRKI